VASQYARRRRVWSGSETTHFDAGAGARAGLAVAGRRSRDAAGGRIGVAWLQRKRAKALAEKDSLRKLAQAHGATNLQDPLYVAPYPQVMISDLVNVLFIPLPVLHVDDRPVDTLYQPVLLLTGAMEASASF